MRILHICMTQYSDGWTYQENLLSKYHIILGNEVIVLTSMLCYQEGKLVEDTKEHFYDINGVEVYRLKKRKEGLFGKLPSYENFYSSIKSIQPDIIFSHGCQYVDVKYIAKYLKINKNVRLFVDNHADFSNSATNFFSKQILHKVIWKHYAKMLVPYTIKFWGVLPARVDFLHDVYDIPKDKVDLLVMGADDEYVKKSSQPNNLAVIRQNLNLSEDDFVLVTGGKIDAAKKQTIYLMEAVKALDIENVKLILFGSISDEIKTEAYRWIDGEKVIYVGWVEPEKSYDYFAIANLVVFPGRHSVFWEQVAGMGIPMICKYWDGTTHIDIGGNVIYLYHDSVEEMKTVLRNCIENKVDYILMKEKAQSIAKKVFSYKEIAKRSIEL